VQKKLAVLLTIFSFTFLMGADFDWMVGLNLRSNLDSTSYRSNLMTRFHTSESRLNLVMKNVASPSDAYMVLRLSEISGRSPQVVLREYKNFREQGWGVTAKKLGIKPGSKAFKALKDGQDIQAFDKKNAKRQKKDDQSNKGHEKKSH